MLRICDSVINMLYCNAGVAFGHVLEKYTNCGKMYQYGMLPYNETQPLMYKVVEINVSVS